jgi:hypothetical protein
VGGDRRRPLRRLAPLLRLLEHVDGGAELLGLDPLRDPGLDALSSCANSSLRGRSRASRPFSASSASGVFADAATAFSRAAPARRPRADSPTRTRGPARPPSPRLVGGLLRLDHAGAPQAARAAAPAASTDSRKRTRSSTTTTPATTRLTISADEEGAGLSRAAGIRVDDG